jgi:ABC-type uncharacterized transport system substrate-binding protein
VVQGESAEIAGKRIQLLKDAVPQMVQVAVLLDPDLPSARLEWSQLESAGRSLNVTLRQLVARRANEFEDAFAGIGPNRPDGLLVTTSSLNFVNRKFIVELAAKHRLPMMTSWREGTEAGGLMSYSSVRTDRFRRAAIYVGKILKGEKPADLPVEQPATYELVINLRTARSLNLEIRRELLLVADDLIE